MEGNKDEAIRCLSIAQKHRDAGNYPSARKFCQKSISLFDTPEAHKLLASIVSQEASSTSSSAPSSSSTGSETHSSASTTKQRHAKSSPSLGTASGQGGEQRSFTPENLAVVKRVRACKVTEYYEILNIKKDCEEVEVKKAYRKLALALHPDKNGAPGADEAFKMVSKAFQVLSDSQKRAIFDQSGSDPEDRTAGRSSGFSGFSSSPFGNGGEGEMSPEDLFNMFFGGGGGGFGGAGGFGGPGVFSASFGPGGFRTTRVHQHQQQRPQQEGEPRSVLLQLLPIIILFAFSMLSSLPGMFSPTPIPDPAYSWDRTSRYTIARKTTVFKVPYHVNAREVMNHPVIGAELIRAGVDLTKSADIPFQNLGPELLKFEGNVERKYQQWVYSLCQDGMNRKERLREREVGLFGIGTDWEKVRKIEAEVIPGCEELTRMGLRR